MRSKRRRQKSEKRDGKQRRDDEGVKREHREASMGERVGSRARQTRRVSLWRQLLSRQQQAAGARGRGGGGGRGSMPPERWSQGSVADWYGRSATGVKQGSERVGGVGGVHRDVAEAPQRGSGRESDEGEEREVDARADELGQKLEAWETGLEETHAREAMLGEEQQAGMLGRERQRLGPDRGFGGESSESGGAEYEAGVAGMNDEAGPEDWIEPEAGETDALGWPEPVGGEWPASAGGDVGGIDGYGADPLSTDVGLPGAVGGEPGAEVIGGGTLASDPWGVPGVAGAGPVDPLSDPLGEWGPDEPEPGW